MTQQNRVDPDPEARDAWVYDNCLSDENRAKLAAYPTKVAMKATEELCRDADVLCEGLDRVVALLGQQPDDLDRAILLACEYCTRRMLETVRDELHAREHAHAH